MTTLSAVGKRNEIGKYLEVERQPDAKGRKTHAWLLYSKNQTDIALGRIFWFGRWRQYCFYPYDATVYNQGCLLDIAAFLESLKGMKH